MGAEPLALVGARLLLRVRDGGIDMEALFRRFSDSGEGKYPESLLEEESTSKVWIQMRLGSRYVGGLAKGCLSGEGYRWLWQLCRKQGYPEDLNHV